MNDFIKGKRLWAQRQNWSNQIDFVLFERNGERIAHSTEILMFAPEKSDEGKQIFPTFSLMPDEAQELIDNLWQLGFRPSEGTGSAGQLAATQKHLEDMRKLVFEKAGLL